MQKISKSKEMQQFTTKKLKSHFSLFKKITAIAGFLKLGQLMGGKFGQNGQKLQESYKINISEAKQ